MGSTDANQSAPDAPPLPYVVKHLDSGWTFVPTSTFVGVVVGAFVAGAGFLVYLSTIFFRAGNSAIGLIFILVAGFSASLAIRGWRTRRTPLNVHSDGRVSYGARELCAAGAAVGVRIVEARSGEVGDCEVHIELADGRLVSIPSQYFAVFKSREHARPFAAAFAKALGVDVRS